MELFSKVKRFLNKIIPGREKKRVHQQNLLELYNKGKYLRVNEDIDNKELMKK